MKCRGTGVILALLDSDALAHNVGWLIALLFHTSYQALSECLILHLINFEAFLRQALLGASEGQSRKQSEFKQTLCRFEV